MAINFNVRNDATISQLRVHPEINRDALNYIAVDFSFAVGLDYLLAYCHAHYAAGAKLPSKTRFLDSVKSYLRENGVESLLSATLDDAQRAAATDTLKRIGALLDSGATLGIPCIAFLFDATGVARVIEREHWAATAAGVPAPTYTLPGLKNALRAQIYAIGRAGIANTGKPSHAALRAAFDAIPLLFTAPPAPETTAPDNATETVTADPIAESTETVTGDNQPAIASALESATVKTGDESPAPETVATGADESPATPNRASRRRNRGR